MRAFEDAVAGLLRGDFSDSEPLFVARSGARPQVLVWLDEGRFAAEPAALAEAFSCACFLGCDEVVDALLRAGVHPDGGILTGMNAFHNAANRGHLETVRRLIRAGASLEAVNRFGGTVLSCTLWSAIKDSRPAHAAIVAELLAAGAKVDAGWYPTGHPGVDAALLAHRNRRTG